MRRLVYAAALAAFGSIGAGAACSSTPSASTPAVTPDAGDDAATPPPPDAGDAAPPCSADVLGDPMNCGRCGHDCHGGACSAGECQPVVLAYDQGGPRKVLVVNGRVYWHNSRVGTIASVPVAGGKPSVHIDGLFTQSGNQVDFTADATGIYVRDAARLYALSLEPPAVLDAAAARPIVPDGDFASAMPAIATDGADVYYVQSAASIAVVPKDGSALPRQIATFPTMYYSTASDTFGPMIVTNADSVFLTSPAQGNIYVASKSAPPVDGGDAGATPTAADFMSQQASPSGLAIDQGVLYWTNFESGSVRARGLDAGGDPTQIASGQGAPRSVVVDQDVVYFANTKTGIVASCPLVGCQGAVHVLVRDLAGPWGVAVEGEDVYFSDEVGGIVARVAK